MDPFHPPNVTEATTTTTTTVMDTNEVDLSSCKAEVASKGGSIAYRRLTEQQQTPSTVERFNLSYRLF